MLGGLALAAAFAVVCVGLGRWQWGRYEDRQVRAAAVTAHYTAAPALLGSAVGRLPLSEDDQWLRVTATGRYATVQPLLVRNRALDGQPGLEVLVPLELDGSLAGRRLVVDRGWVPNADSASQLPAVPAVPTGDVTVQGWLRSGEADLGKDLPAGQLASIDLGTVEAQTGGAGGAGGEVLDAYLDLESETTGAGTPARPAPLETPDTGLGPHQAYAFQWWLTSLFGFVLVGYRLRVATTDGPPDRGRAVSAGAAPRQKVRIWDEEDG